MYGLLTTMILSPAAAAILLAVVPPGATVLLRRLALFASLVPFGLSVAVWSAYDPAIAGFQLVERTTWISELGISYYLGLDGISLLLVMLTTLLTPLVLLAAPDQIHTRLKAYLISVLLLETSRST